MKFLNTGQACISPNRIFVQRDNLEPFVSTLAERVSAMTAGSGFDEKVAIGPLVNESALKQMVSQVEDARAKGAEVVCGGDHRVLHPARRLDQASLGVSVGVGQHGTVLADALQQVGGREDLFAQGPAVPAHGVGGSGRFARGTPRVGFMVGCGHGCKDTQGRRDP